MKVFLLLLVLVHLALGSKPLFMSEDDKTGSVKAAKVKGLMGSVQSYAALLPFNKDNSKAMFFWYFPSMKSPKNAPVVVWIQGWSTSSLYGLFLENGPFKVNDKMNLEKRTYSWTRFCHMIYLESPVGLGFSFSKDPELIPHNSTFVGVDLYKTLIKFFEFFPEIKNNSLYIGGESYGGKYGASLGRFIQEQETLNLKGIFLGNPYIDPTIQINYGDYLYQHGLVDDEQRDYFVKTEKLIQNYTEQDYFLPGSIALGQLIFAPQGSYFEQTTGLKSIYNFINDKPIEEKWKSYIETISIKEAIHVGDLPFNNGSEVVNIMIEDLTTTAKPWLERMLKKFKVLIYGGLNDIACQTPNIDKLTESLNWDGQKEFNLTKREIWWDGKDLAGYKRSFNNLTVVTVRNADHMTVMDKPHRIYLLVKSFVTNTRLEETSLDD